MMRKCLLSLAFTLQLAAILLVTYGTFHTVPLFAAGTAPATRYDVPRRDVVRYTIPWTSTSGGDVNTNPFTVVPGYLVSIRFIPGSGGSQPSDAYDVTLSDGIITDLTGGQGANLSNAVASTLSWNPPLFQDGTHTFDVVVAHAGSVKTGTVVIYVQAPTR